MSENGPPVRWRSSARWTVRLTVLGWNVVPIAVWVAIVLAAGRTGPGGRNEDLGALGLLIAVVLGGIAIAVGVSVGTVTGGVLLARRSRATGMEPPNGGAAVGLGTAGAFFGWVVAVTVVGLILAAIEVRSLLR